MKVIRAAVASAAVILSNGAGGAYAADMTTTGRNTPAPAPGVEPAGTSACTSIVDFFTTACQIAAYGIRFYGTIDVGVSYMTNGSRGDQLANVNFFPGKPSLGAKVLPGFNALTPSNFGFLIKEPAGNGWSFIGQLETAWLPWSGQLLNGVHSVATQIGVPLAFQTSAGDSNSQGAFYNGLGFTGFSHDTWGTVTVFRQNTLGQDLFLSYDPMTAAPGFSVPGFYGAYAGGGDTQNRKDTTAVKYRVNVANWRFAAYGQFGGYGDGNGSKGAVQGDIGADFNVGPGVFSGDVVGAYRKSAVALSLGGPVDPFGNPVNIFTSAATMTATISDNTSVIVGTKYQVDRLKLYAGYEWIQFANPSEPSGPFTDIAGDFVCSNTGTGSCGALIGTNINNSAFSHGDKIQQLVWTGFRYALTDSLDLASAYYHVWQNDFSGGLKNSPAAGTGSALTCGATTTALGSCAGTIDAASVLLDWKFAPKWDTYIGTLYSRLNGGFANGFLARDNWSTTAGLRFRW
jgi:predicted porin